MTSREYLQHVWMVDARVHELEMEAKTIEENITSLAGTDYSKPMVNGGLVSDTSEKVIKWLEARHRAELEQEHWRQVREECRQIIMSIACGEKTAIVQIILKYRYIDHQQWERIAVDLGYSYRRTLQLHGLALIEFDKAYKRFHIISHEVCDMM